MADRKIVVPEGMLKAACNAYSVEPKLRSRSDTVFVLEAALLWLSENPIVPTAAWSDSTIRGWDVLTEQSLIAAILEWQRRMFLAPDMKVPREILDLHVSDTEMGWDSPINKRIIEAFRRGQKSKESK